LAAAWGNGTGKWFFRKIYNKKINYLSLSCLYSPVPFIPACPGCGQAKKLTPSAKRKRKKIPSVNFFAEGVLNSLAEGGEKCPKGTTYIDH
jgi:hypothetical protein